MIGFFERLMVCALLWDFQSSLHVSFCCSDDVAMVSVNLTGSLCAIYPEEQLLSIRIILKAEARAGDVKCPNTQYASYSDSY